VRVRIAARYDEALAEGAAELGVARVPWTGRSAHHLYAVLVPPGTRDRVLDGLGARQVGCAVNYRSVHTLSYYRERFGHAREAFPHAADFGERTISLPMWPGLPLEAADRVVEALVAAVKEARG
jgi:dTDP-4-amino-4,6-dideoxygalactose transaminase